MPEQEKVNVPPDEDNELHVHYVDVAEEKEASIILPLISLVLAIGTFLFYPLQATAIILCIVTMYITRNHAITYKPMTMIAFVLALVGFFIGMGGVDIYDSMIPVFHEMKTGISCDTVELHVDSACFDTESDQIIARMQTSQNIYKANLEIVTNSSTYQSKINDPILINEVATVQLSVDDTEHGIPNLLRITPIIRSVITKDVFVCQDQMVSVDVGACS